MLSLIHISAFAAADGQTSEGVFKDLLKAEEFQDALIDARMKAQATLIGADRTVELDAVSPVDLILALVVDPRNTEADDALRFDKAFKQLGLLIFGMALQDAAQGVENLGGCLKKFRLMRVFFLDRSQDLINIAH